MAVVYRISAKIKGGGGHFNIFVLPCACGDPPVTPKPDSPVLLGDGVGLRLQCIGEVGVRSPQRLFPRDRESDVGLVAHEAPEVQSLVHPRLGEVEVNAEVLKSKIFVLFDNHVFYSRTSKFVFMLTIES